MEAEFYRTWMRCMFLREASLGSAESQNNQVHLLILNVSSWSWPQNPKFWSGSAFCSAQPVHVWKAIQYFGPTVFSWIRPVGFLINVYSIISLCLLPGLPIFPLQVCFLSTLLAPMSRNCYQLRPMQLSLHAVSRICSLSVFCTDQASWEPVDFRALTEVWYKCLSMGTTAGWIHLLINKLTFRRSTIFHSTSTFFPLLQHKESSNWSFKKDLKPHWFSLKSIPLLLTSPNLKRKK